MDRFQIYYKEKNKNVHTYNITRISKETNTYKLKVILEEFDSKTLSYNKYKMKEFKIGVEDILNKINSIDFNKNYIANISDNLAYCQISFGDKKIAVNDIELIREYLDLFKFLEICQITKNEYKYVKDIEEYVILRNIFCQKCQDVEFDKLEKIISTIVDGNPYDVFETFEFFDEFVENL